MTDDDLSEGLNKYAETYRAMSTEQYVQETYGTFAPHLAVGEPIPNAALCTWNGIREYAVYLYCDRYYVTHERIIQGCYLTPKSASNAYSNLVWPVVETDPAYTSAMEYLDRLRKEICAMSGIDETDLGEIQQSNYSPFGYKPAQWMKKYYDGVVDEAKPFTEKDFTTVRERLIMMSRRPGKNFVVTGVDESGNLKFGSLPALIREAMEEENNDGNPYLSEEMLHERIQGHKVDFFDFENKPLVSPEPQEGDDPNGVYPRKFLPYMPTKPIDMKLTPYGGLLFSGLGGSYEPTVNRDAAGNIVSWTHTFTNHITSWDMAYSLKKKPKLQRGHKSGRKHPYRTKRDRVRYQKK